MRQALAYLKKHQNQVVRLAQELVRINSVHDNEVQVARVIQHTLSKHGIKSRIIGPRGNRKSLVADLGRGKRVLMLNGHLDTVPVGNQSKWRYAPLSGTITGGRLYGRGAMDMKASVAAAAFTAISLVETETRLAGKLRLLFNFDEENGEHLGITDALRRGISADAALIGEPMGEKTVDIGAKGFYRFELVVEGQSGHTSSPVPSGVNAVTRMAKLLLALEQLRPSYRKHPLFTHPLITPGTVISGGIAINVYPDQCRALVDCRLSYGQTKARLKQEIRQCLESVRRRDKTIVYRIKDLFELPPALTDQADPIVSSTCRAFRQIAGYEPRLATMNGATDGNILSAAGIPMVSFGVEGKNIHSENEYADLRSIHLMPRLYLATAVNYLGM